MLKGSWVPLANQCDRYTVPEGCHSTFHHSPSIQGLVSLPRSNHTHTISGWGSGRKLDGCCVVCSHVQMPCLTARIPLASFLPSQRGLLWTNAHVHPLSINYIYSCPCFVRSWWRRLFCPLPLVAMVSVTTWYPLYVPLSPPWTAFVVTACQWSSSHLPREYRVINVGGSTRQGKLLVGGHLYAAHTAWVEY